MIKIAIMHQDANVKPYSDIASIVSTPSTIEMKYHRLTYIFMFLQSQILFCFLRKRIRRGVSLLSFENKNHG